MTKAAAVGAALAAASALVVPAWAEAQCAMCRSVLGSPEGQAMIAALRSGILLLLAAPFAIFGTVAFLAVRAQRKRTATSTTPRSSHE